MFEQSALHGILYRSEKQERSIASQTVSLNDMTFGPMRSIHIYPHSDQEFLVYHLQGQTWYHYQSLQQGQTPKLQQIYTNEQLPPAFQAWTCQENQFFYYYGQAQWKDPRTGACISDAYYVQNSPTVTSETIPDIQTMELPLTLQKLDYTQTFTYPEELNQLLGNLSAAYTDRYKRPIQRKRGRTYPIAMEKVTTTWKDLPASTYPKVVNLSNTFFAVLDLEPDHTEEDLDEFQKMPGFYEEETPKGGKHKLIAVNSSVFKFRFSKGLELINESMVTFYGIRGTWITKNPIVADIRAYQPIGHTTRQITTRLERPDVTEAVQALQQKAAENMSMLDIKISEIYRTDTDNSHADFVALVTIYHSDIKPYELNFERTQLPWIMEAYAKPWIPHREKHETMRNGLPYLVYLSSIIIQERNCETYGKSTHAFITN